MLYFNTNVGATLSRRQSNTLDRLLHMARELYNAALQERRDAWKRAGNSITYFDQTKSLTMVRNDDPEWKALTVTIGRGALKAIDRAFQAFFPRRDACALPCEKV